MHSDLKPYWSYRDKLAIIDRVVLKGRCIIIPTSLKQQGVGTTAHKSYGYRKN